MSLPSQLMGGLLPNDLRRLCRCFSCRRPLGYGWLLLLALVGVRLASAASGGRGGGDPGEGSLAAYSLVDDDAGGPHRHHRVLSATPAGRPTFLQGNLGTVRPAPQEGAAGGHGGGGGDADRAFRAAAKATLEGILQDRLALGNKPLINWKITKVGTDAGGNSHVRFQPTIGGIPVEAAALIMHVDPRSTVYALNGDLVSDIGVDMAEPQLDCAEAMDVALQDLRFANATDGAWRTSDCELSYVQARSGTIHKAWTRTYAYHQLDEEGSNHNRLAVDKLFASVTTGELVAVIPKIHGSGIPRLQTRDCETTDNCTELVTNSSLPIATGDAAVDDAHNYAIDVYRFYFDYFNRTSLDGNDLPIVSNVHYGYQYFNAFWDGDIRETFYGDGDGSTSRPLCRALDVVAHELTHGVTDFESELYYYGESGAMNEAMSDIFGAVIEHLVKGKSVADTFRVGEDFYIFDTELRTMNDPAVHGDYDYYPDRYLGDADAGGVHWNSGIMNLAFALMVMGGKHPRGKTTNVVPALDTNFTRSIKMAAAIFYHANTNCLTPNSAFADARLCTIQAAEALYGYGSSQRNSVAKAWTAVGVNELASLRNGTPLKIANLLESQRIYYALEGCRNGETVTVQLTGSNGDTDLYVQWNTLPQVGSADFACRSWSSSSNEYCQLNATSNATLYILVHGYSAATAVKVLARHYPNILQVSSGVKVTALSSDTAGLIQDFQLNEIRTGDQVKCELSGSNGDADLFVRFGSLAETSTTCKRNACSSAKGSSSKEVCTTFGASRNTSALATIYTTQPYSNVELGCSILPCAGLTESCRASTCCASLNPGKKVVCDGPIGAATCKYCKAKEKACVRNTQCCSGRCGRYTRKCQ